MNKYLDFLTKDFRLYVVADGKSLKIVSVIIRTVF